MEVKKLFEPIQVGSLTLSNRIIMPALTTFYDLFDVEGGDRFINFYLERVRGGVSLVVIGALQALYPGRGGESGWVPDESVKVKGLAKINHDFYIPRLQKWTQAIRECGGKSAAQLAVYGYWAKGGYGTPAEEVSPSGVRLEGEMYRPDLDTLTFIRGGRPLTIEEIHQIADEIGDAALRAKKAGFDAIELQACGGNLISRFLSPLTNKRQDEYGGPLKNRARFLLEAIHNIKRKVGEDFPLLCRINGDDLMPGGMGVRDYQELAPWLEEAGVHCIDVLPFWYESRQPVNQMCVPRGAFVYVSEGLKKVVKIPVTANVRINDPFLAERILQEEKADIIAMCSPLIADPEFPKKAREGNFEDIRRCVACCACWSEIAEHHQPLICSVNAHAGKESQFQITPAKKNKRVWIIGGGPAGMEAARLCSLRGHQVTLFERKERLGGQLLYAILPPYKEEWKTFLEYLETQLKKLRVRIHLQTEVTPEMVEMNSPDTVIIATGAKPIIPNIPGIEGEHVATAIEVLTEVKELGDRVVIVGGGFIGCETAEFISKKGKKVTILEMLPRIGPDIDLWNRWVILDRLKAAGIQMEADTKVIRINDGEIEAEYKGRLKTFFADSVVIAVGMAPDDFLYKRLEGRFRELHRIGDCIVPKKVKGAIADAFQIALSI
ncbi:MAG: FAD-dependent oxidoreductase [Candidatus Anstonellales archaeon]